MKKNFLPSVFIYTEETEETKPSKAKPRKNEFAIREIKHSQNLILSKIYSIKRSYLSHPEDRHFFRINEMSFRISRIGNTDHF